MPQLFEPYQGPKPGVELTDSRTFFQNFIFILWLWKGSKTSDSQNIRISSRHWLSIHAWQMYF